MSISAPLVPLQPALLPWLAALAAGLALLLAAALAWSFVNGRRQHREAHWADSLRLANEQLRQLAFRDRLTGLATRTVFEERLRATVTRLALRGGAGELPGLAVLFIDLDGFKPINDCYGHACGDQLLREVGVRLAALVRAQDTLARVGGDEFVLLLDGDLDGEVATCVAQRMIESLRRPFALDAGPVTLSCSIGIALYPTHGDSDERLLAAADAAMYVAKRRGGSTWALYEPSMDNHAAEQVELQEALRHAVSRHELSLDFQPKICCGSGELHSLEALLRWHRPGTGYVSPAVFVPVAERFGLIGLIGDWVIDEACRQLAAWNAAGLRWHVAINLSEKLLRRDDLPEQVRRSLERHGVDASQLSCEITESSLIENAFDERRRLDSLNALGVQISIDDFGTGYSSLAYLRTLPAQEVKIDRVLVHDVATDADARAVLRAIVDLAHALRMRVVAEGIETAEQGRALSALGCDVLQGFHLARPMPAEALVEWVHSRPAALEDETAAPPRSVDFA